MGSNISIPSTETMFAVAFMMVYKTATVLPKVKIQVKILLEELYKNYEIPANKYYDERITHNRIMMKSGEDMIESLRQFSRENKIDASFVMTSSLNADTNLIDDSDIDISMVVQDLDEEKINNMSELLLKFGFKYNKIVNPTRQKSLYHSFCLIKDGIEFELKLRDKTNSQAILKLHEHMETKIPINDKKAITYGKLIFKKLSKTTKEKELEDIYKVFKKLVYEMYFADIAGGFMFDLI